MLFECHIILIRIKTVESNILLDSNLTHLVSLQISKNEHYTIIKTLLLENFKTKVDYIVYFSFNTSLFVLWEMLLFQCVFSRQHKTTTFFIISNFIIYKKKQNTNDLKKSVSSNLWPALQTAKKPRTQWWKTKLRYQKTLPPKTVYILYWINLSVNVNQYRD